MKLSFCLLRCINVLVAPAPRQYSISPLALTRPENVPFTIAVHESPALSGHGIHVPGILEDLATGFCASSSLLKSAFDCHHRRDL